MINKRAERSARYISAIKGDILKNLKGSLMLLVAALIWGTAFVAQSTAADSVGSFTFNAARSFIGSLFLALVIIIRSLITRKPIVPPDKKGKKRALLAGVCCGVVLFAAINFQQFGIAVYPDGVASSGRAGFLTAMYVVMVALSGAFSGKKLHPVILTAAGVAMVGMYLLCLSSGLTKIYMGDLLCFICAICFTAHILVIDKFSDVDGVTMSCLQFFVCSVLSGVAMLIFEKPSLPALAAAWLPLLYTAVMSSGIAYTLQIIGQKDAEPAVASIVMSLESVFAGLGGWIILSEKLSARELFGCVLVFVAVILAQLPSFFKKTE